MVFNRRGSKSNYCWMWPETWHQNCHVMKPFVVCSTSSTLLTHIRLISCFFSSFLHFHASSSGIIFNLSGSRVCCAFFSSRQHQAERSEANGAANQRGNYWFNYTTRVPWIHLRHRLAAVLGWERWRGEDGEGNAQLAEQLRYLFSSAMSRTSVVKRSFRLDLHIPEKSEFCWPFGWGFDMFIDFRDRKKKFTTLRSARSFFSIKARSSRGVSHQTHQWSRTKHDSFDLLFFSPSLGAPRQIIYDSRFSVAAEQQKLSWLASEFVWAFAVEGSLRLDDKWLSEWRISSLVPRRKKKNDNTTGPFAMPKREASQRLLFKSRSFKKWAPASTQRE